MPSSEFPLSAGNIRDVTINIRVKKEQRDLIDQAAQIAGKTRSEFMLESAYQKAQEVILDRCFFGLNEVKFQEFTALLDAVPIPNEKLKNLLKSQPLWD